jgi:hypothetical protein
MSTPETKSKDRDIVITKSGRKDESSSSSSVQRLKKKSLHPPIETHWDLPTQKGKKRSSFSIKSLLSYPLMKLGRTKSIQMILEGTHDPNDEQIVHNFREMLSREGLLPPKHNDYHTLLR